MLKYVKNAINIIDELKRYNAIIDEEKCINCREVFAMNKSKILFVVWIIGVILLLLGMKYDMRNIFSLITGMIIGGGAVTFLLTYIENR